MILHPVTRFIIAACFVGMGFVLPLEYQAIEVLLGALFVWGVVKRILPYDPGRTFIRLWLTAGFFLFVMHGLNFSGDVSIESVGIKTAGRNFFRIGALMVSFLWLIRTIKQEELYAFLIDLRLPLPIIYLIFQTVFLIPRFGERAGEIIIAQQARGFIFKGFLNRAKALSLIFPPLFSSMIYELEETAASLSARGLRAQGRKSHLCQIRFSPFDLMITITSFFLTIIVFLIAGS